MTYKHGTEIERANRMFAVEKALNVKGVTNENVLPVAKEIFDFLQENPVVQYPETGFSPNSIE